MAKLDFQDRAAVERLVQQIIEDEGAGTAALYAMCARWRAMEAVCEAARRWWVGSGSEREVSAALARLDAAGGDDAKG